jgi:DNA helicase-2/ATP-dependent DNA helicase PcrA
MAFVPSAYQQAIFDWAIKGRGDALVEAVAGSGKTTTIVELSRRLNTGDALFLAFNVKIVNELKARLGPTFPVSTINSLGCQALKRGGIRLKKTDARKYNKLVYQSVKDMGLEPKQLYPATTKIEEIIKFAMSDMSDMSDASLEETMSHYGLEFHKNITPQDTFALVRSLMATGEAMARQGIINFDEQIYLPVKWGMSPAQASFVMVDECQDLSKSKLLLVLSARGKGGRMVFVGDPRQSIYGFAGADAEAVPRILEMTGATVFPLSVSYRCAKAIVAHAQEIVPTIEASPNAPDGIVEYVSEDTLISEVKDGDLVLCRLTAPLVSLCIRLIAKRIPARVKGKNIGTSLVNLVREALGSRPWSELDSALDTYMDESVAVLLGRANAEKAISALNDKVAGVRACVEGFRSTSFDSFKESVEAIFTEDKASVELSTVHRLKGAEAETVYVVKPGSLPLTWKNQQEWEYEQEQNIMYVARTRAKLRLRYVRDEG